MFPPGQFLSLSREFGSDGHEMQTAIASLSPAWVDFSFMPEHCVYQLRGALVAEAIRQQQIAPPALTAQAIRTCRSI